MVDVPVNPVAVFEIILDEAVNCVHRREKADQVLVIRSISFRRYGSREVLAERPRVPKPAFIRSSAEGFPSLILFLLDLLHILNTVF